MKRFDIGREVLKLVAILTMTIDHTGAILYPTNDLLRIVGRISFPLFCYLIILGIESTRSVKNYFGRLFVFALISQIPYYLAFNFEPFESLNIFFTLSSGLIFIVFVKKKSLLLLFPMLASSFLNFDYGLYGIAFILGLHLLQEDPKKGISLLILLNGAFLFTWSIQIFSLLALPLIFLHKKGTLRIEREIDEKAASSILIKYLFYIYYPLHLTVFYLIK